MTTSGCSIVDLAEQIFSDLNRQIVFLGEHAERAGHSATTGIEQRRFSSRQPLHQPRHEGRVHQRLGVAMRMNRHVNLLSPVGRRGDRRWIDL